MLLKSTKITKIIFLFTATLCLIFLFSSTEIPTSSLKAGHYSAQSGKLDYLYFFLDTDRSKIIFRRRFISGNNARSRDIILHYLPSAKIKKQKSFIYENANRYFFPI